MRAHHRFALSLFTALAVQLPASAATIVTDLPLVAGPNSAAIDPVGAETWNLDATATTGALASQAVLEARTDLWTMQGFAGFVGGGDYTNNFTNVNLPDIRFLASGTVASGTGGTGNDTTGAGQNTSAGTAYNFAAGSSTGTLTLRIEFGTWNGSTFANDRAVDAVGFMVAGVRTNNTVNVSMFNSTNVLLGAFTLAGNDSDSGEQQGREGYFGFESGLSNDIAYLIVQKTATSNGSSAAGLDDFSFTAVPEPSQTLLLTVGLLMLGLRRRR